MTPDNRKKALEWWKSLTLDEQIKEHSRSAYIHWTLAMFSMSTSAITKHWMKVHGVKK